MTPMQVTVAALIGIGAAAWLLRRIARPDVITPPDLDGVDEADEPGQRLGLAGSRSSKAVAVTSDGWGFVPREGTVELVPPGETEDAWLEASRRSPSVPRNPQTGGRLPGWKPGGVLSPGDLIATRVRRGAPGVDPWRLEALGRDYDFRAWPFETQEAAQVALRLIEEHIVRPPRDPDGNPIPVGDEDFVVARRKMEETERQLALELPEDDFEEDE
ncbi:MAG: hypothetical protein E6K73_04235 [Candidatus Eisenbacteria bacterium]|uniref:Uncharacterized protein n=1 Tax=Eiseniibacteriota bacterium TaxID=2212470 RepID=A0A538SKT6_UNCEI|nr:MAG: hypothetical protein E6K73_04235 [Candidatus Eisenbacteria bacterium]